MSFSFLKKKREAQVGNVIDIGVETGMGGGEGEQRGSCPSNLSGDIVSAALKENFRVFQK